MRFMATVQYETTFHGNVTLIIEEMENGTFIDENDNSGFVEELEFMRIDNNGVIRFFYNYKNELHAD